MGNFLQHYLGTVSEGPRYIFFKFQIVLLRDKIKEREESTPLFRHDNKLSVKHVEWCK